MTEAKATEGGFAKLAGYGGAVVGFVLARYCGLSLIIPGAIAIGAYWLGHKRLTGARRVVLASATIAIGHMGWMAFGAAYLGNWSLVSTDLAVFTALLAWLFARPSTPPLIALAAFQTMSLFINVNAISKLEVGTPSHASLTAHIVLRVACLICVYFAINALKVDKAAPIVAIDASS
jgi:hypothetical protein